MEQCVNYSVSAGNSNITYLNRIMEFKNNVWNTEKMDIQQ